MNNITFLGGTVINQRTKHRCFQILEVQDHSELYSRVGQFGYVSSHILFFAKIATPLKQLMVADKFTWTKECQLAFEIIKLAVKLNIKNYAVSLTFHCSYLRTPAK